MDSITLLESMMMMLLKKTLFLIAIALLLSTVVKGQATTTARTSPCDACQFVVDTDPSDCKVYGQLGDDVLIAWSRASQDCLDYHKIKVQSVDPTLLASAFPNADGSDGNVAAFVNILRFQASSAVVNGILLSLTDLFDEDDNGNAITKDTIVVDGVTYDCQASMSDCWNKGVRAYFSMEPGASEMQAIGKNLYDRQRLDKELEQSTVRIAICNEGSVSVCEPLHSEIEDKKAQTDKACSAFGLGPAENTIPGCENIGSSLSASATSSTPRQLTGAFYWYNAFVCSVIAFFLGRFLAF